MWSTMVYAAALLFAQAAEAPTVQTDPLKVGVWHAWLDSPGGDLPFEMDIQHEKDGWKVWIINGAERSKVPIVRFLPDDRVIFGVDHYDASILCNYSAGGSRLDGAWKRRAAGNTWITLPFHATAGAAERFKPDNPDRAASNPASKINGRWSVKFADEEDPAVGIFEGANGPVTGTFLTVGGDYRYLAGTLANGRLRLSTFDGSHAFLFQADLQEDGTLRGDFWSGAAWHETWTARRDDHAALPDPFTLTKASSDDADLAKIRFPDLSGVYHALNDSAYAGKARIIEVFGSWCPNCHDASELLVELDHRYRQRGLSILGLAFELSGEVNRDAKQVKRFAAMHGVEYPLLIAGVSDREKASKALPILDRLRAYPTTIFLDAEGTVRAVHSGFTGPAAAGDHAALRAKFETIIEQILADPASPPPTEDPAP